MAKADARTKVRNIGIAAHIDAGKTTLTERILYYTGSRHKIGEVHDGDAHMDFMAEEQAHGITITAAVTKCPWNDHLIQVIDTPGHVDFTIEVERAMRVLDGAVVVLDSVRGVEPQTETVWRQVRKFDLPAFFFANKMDRPGASFERVLASVRDRLGAEPVPVVVPLTDRVIHLIDKTCITFSGEMGEEITVEPVSDEDWAEVAVHREALLLGLAEHNEELADIVLLDEVPEDDMIRRVLKEATHARQVQPVFGGSALKNLGVQPLLDAVIDYMPSPLDGGATIGMKDGEPVEVLPDIKGPFAAVVFKVQLLEGRRFVFARIYRGSIEGGEKVRNVTQGIDERVARVFDIDAGKKQKIAGAIAGQIVLFGGMRHAATGDTLTSFNEQILLAPIVARDPVLGLAIEAASGKDETKLLEVLERIQEEDPTLVLEEDPETGQRVLRGMGELHLQIVFERLEREFNLKVRAGKPAVVTRETIAESGRAESLFHRSIPQGESELELKALAIVKVSPRDRGTGLEIISNPHIRPEDTELTPEQHAAIKEGATDGANAGPSHGQKLEDVRIEVVAVEVFGKSSIPNALRAAVAEATRKALVDAGGLLLQPLMATEVVVPADCFGSVLGDLQSRGAVIRDTESVDGVTTISCEVPLISLLGYTTQIRSMTQGRGQFTMEFLRFDVSSVG